jgi:hypothetical protein
MISIQMKTLIYLLPNENVVNDSSTAKDDSETDDDRGDDRRRRIEMKKGIQNDA